MVYNGQYAILCGDWSPFWHDAIDLIGTKFTNQHIILKYELYDTGYNMYRKYQ